jgi:hypothetical protein
MNLLNVSSGFIGLNMHGTSRHNHVTDLSEGLERPPILGCIGIHISWDLNSATIQIMGKSTKRVLIKGFQNGLALPDCPLAQIGQDSFRQNKALSSKILLC